MKSYSLEELAQHHANTASIACRYVVESDYQQLAAQNAELLKQLEALKDWRRLALQFDGQRMQAMSLLKGVANKMYDRKEIHSFLAEAPVSGNKHLRELKAEAIRELLGASLGHGTSRGVVIGVDVIEQYAEKVRNSEV